jgi:hypothetical protein
VSEQSCSMLLGQLPFGDFGCPSLFYAPLGPSQPRRRRSVNPSQRTVQFHHDVVGGQITGCKAIGYFEELFGQAVL